MFNQTPEGKNYAKSHVVCDILNLTRSGLKSAEDFCALKIVKLLTFFG